MRVFTAILLTAAAFEMPVAVAQQGRGADFPPAAGAEESPKVPEPQGIETTEEEEFDRHHIALFTGGSHQGSENGFTMGGEYEYRFHRLVGAGVMGEYTWSFREDVLVFPVYFHPGAGLILAAGPGIDRPTGKKPETNGQVDSEGTAFLVRVAVQYEFEVGKGFSITPNALFDFVDGGQVFGYGVSFGYGF